MGLIVQSFGMLEAATYYVAPSGTDDGAAGRGSETSPYATPGYAAAKATQKGDEIILAPGVYRLTATVTAKASSVRFTGRPTAGNPVVFDGQGAVRCFYDGGYGGLRISGITFANGRQTTEAQTDYAYSGAGMRLSSVSTVVSNCVFSCCTNSGCFGGGLSSLKAVTVVDTVFTNCYARYSGGGADVVGGRFERCRFQDCYASGVRKTGTWGCGGGVNCQATDGTEFLGCAFVACESVAYGAVLSGYVKRAEECLFETNKCAHATNAGLVYLCAEYSPAGTTNGFKKCVFRNNVTGAAGIFYTRGYSMIELDGCTITNNTSGSCVLAGRNASIGSEFVLAMKDTVCSDNRTTTAGGLVSNGTVLLVERCTLANNSFADRGASFLPLHTDGARVTDSFIINNYAKCAKWGSWSSGFLLDVSVSNVLIRNCVIARNAAGQTIGSGIYVHGANANAIIESCSFVCNTNTHYNKGQNVGGAAICAKDSGLVAVTNCVFYRNCGYVGAAVSGVAQARIGSCWVSDTVSGVKNNEYGCIVDTTHNPGFVDVDADDYQLLKTSVLVDRGANQPWMDTAHDITGLRSHHRIMRDRVDIGAYEFYVTQGLLLFVR